VYKKATSFIGFSLSSLAGFYIVCVVLASICAYISFLISYINPELLWPYKLIAQNKFQSCEYIPGAPKGKTIVRFTDGGSCELIDRLILSYASGTDIKIYFNERAQGNDRYRITKIK